MKKFILCLFILLIFGGFVFYKGWTQFKVDSDKCGILVSKTSGIHEKPLLPGEFNWNWEFLLPTNSKIIQFSIEPLNVTKSVCGELPSGSIYTSIYNSNDNFSYSFEFSISLTISPDSLIKLYSENIITDSQDLTDYLNGAADSIAQLTCNYYLSKLKESPQLKLESIRRDDIIKAIKYYQEYPDIDVTTIALKSSKIPDFELYTKLQNQFLSSTSQNLSEYMIEEGE